MPLRLSLPHKTHTDNLTNTYASGVLYFRVKYGVKTGFCRFKKVLENVSSLFA